MYVTCAPQARDFFWHFACIFIENHQNYTVSSKFSAAARPRSWLFLGLIPKSPPPCSQIPQNKGDFAKGGGDLVPNTIDGISTQNYKGNGDHFQTTNKSGFLPDDIPMIGPNSIGAPSCG